MADVPKPRISRRKLLKRAAIAAGVTGLATAGWTWQVEPFWCELVERTMKLEKLPPRWVGRMVVQISDLHVFHVRPSYLLKQLARVNDLRPDLLLITGDFAGIRSPAQMPAVREVLRTLKSPPLGMYACLGNHDYGRAWSDLNCGDAVTRAATDADIRVLRNERVVVDDLELLGFEDLWSPNYDGERVMRQASGDAASITLCHNPDTLDRPVWGDYRGQILSGHTHGGQCKPPFLPPPLLPVSNERYVAGEYAVAPGRTLYINRAIGHTLQVRFNCRPEITRFRLENA